MIAFDAIEGIGNQWVVAGLRALMAITVNANTAGEKVSPADFLQGWTPAPEAGEDDFEGLTRFFERRVVA